MRAWGDRVPTPQPKVEVPVALVPASVPAVVPSGSFSIAGFAIKQDAEGRYCLNDLHKASGEEHKHKTAYFMENQQTSNLISVLQKDGIPAFSITRGRTGGTYVAKELVYAYAMWISPEFHVQVIRAYDALVTEQTYVMPPKQLDLMKRSMLMLAEVTAGFEEQLDKNAVLTEKLEIAQPKAEALDSMKVYSLSEVVKNFREIGFTEMTVDKLSNILALYGYLTKIRRVPAKSKWWERWFSFGLADVVRQDGCLFSGSGEVFITQTGIEGITDLVAGMDENEIRRFGVVN